MAKQTDIQISICGSAGDGTIAVGDIFKRAMARAGYRVIAFDHYPAEIRGFGKCISRTRISTNQVYSMKSYSDVLVSLNDLHAIPHVGEVRDYGAIIYDSAPMSAVAEGAHISGHLMPGHLPYALPIRELSELATGANRSRNIVALGFIAGLYQLPQQAFHQAIAAKFETKAPAVADTALAAFDSGFKSGSSTYKFDDVQIDHSRARKNGGEVRMMTGNGAIAHGCLEAGIETFFGYPITPATGIMERLAVEMPRRGGRLVQTEDEIAAISATIGAGYAGARAATATSGPGLALMAEMLGLGVMAEVPAVVFVSQRGGPSTGMPTKTEQSDLNLAVWGGHGDARRIVLAPTNVEGCRRCAARAFEMAEKFQVPVIVLIDLYLSNRYETVFLQGEDNFLPKNWQRVGSSSPGDNYRRYELTADGLSPRCVPGEAGGIHTATGLEHDEYGHPNDNPDVHSLMSKKRHEKLRDAMKYPGINFTKRFGDKGKIDVGLLAWGSTFGEALEAVLLAREEGIRCAAMKVVMMSPLPTRPILRFCNDCQQVLVPELNYTGQFANLVAGELGRPVVRVSHATGAPMDINYLLTAIRNAAKKKLRSKTTTSNPTKA